ncbi:IclR family transcriptional regulator C-terminal domain-containing protein, partial [Streptomyces sp. NPDC051098]|uniref:IclR family transcriptional regulator domain-containing protein n=1 Tax=Streptomyces sp. NPDC051098 TaxID=3155411 RepID=UPI003421119A
AVREADQGDAEHAGAPAQDEGDPGALQAGVASVSAPVRGPSNRVVAAVSVSGPIERLTRHPGRMHAQAVIDAAGRLSEALRRTG